MQVDGFWKREGERFAGPERGASAEEGSIPVDFRKVLLGSGGFRNVIFFLFFSWSCFCVIWLSLSSSSVFIRSMLLGSFFLLSMMLTVFSFQ